LKKVAIIGGGISGLTLAYVLRHKRDDLEITVYEADDRPGGKIRSEKADGFLCEKGPNGFLDNKPRTLELCKSLGIDPVRSNENSKKRFIFTDNKLKPLPESPVSFIKSDLLSWGGKFRLLLELNTPKGPADETVADFIIRRLGQEALDKLIDPMCSGIYAGDPYRMSIKNCFARIKELEQEYGSLIKAMIAIKKQRKNEKVSAAPGGTLTSFFDGAQTITDSLAEKLGSSLKLGLPVKEIRKDTSSYKLETSGETIDADIVVFATPAYATAEMFRGFDEEMTTVLSKIPYPHVSVVCFGYKKEQVSHPLDGFGFLIPHKEGRNILGNLWDSSVFPNRAEEGHVLLRAMVGGAKNPSVESLDDDKLTSMVFDELNSILGLKSAPEMTRVYRWNRAIPQYLMAHTGILDATDKILKKYPGLYITGNAYRGIGINDCVEHGYRIADEIASSIGDM
jgi:oxygen-dependent protoporphyrinogen oxidase